MGAGGEEGVSSEVVGSVSASASAVSSMMTRGCTPHEDEEEAETDEEGEEAVVDEAAAAGRTMEPNTMAEHEEEEAEGGGIEGGEGLGPLVAEAVNNETRDPLAVVDELLPPRLTKPISTRIPIPSTEPPASGLNIITGDRGGEEGNILGSGAPVGPRRGEEKKAAGES